METQLAEAPVNLPRVAITYCTQCKWLLRAAYFGQELLSTFGTSIGEIALIPATGGIFTVHLTHLSTAEDVEGDAIPVETLVWDRKAEGGFPETKILKQRVRNVIEPGKDLGHSDKPSSKAISSATTGQSPDAVFNGPAAADPGPGPTNATVALPTASKDCEDCR